MTREERLLREIEKDFPYFLGANGNLIPVPRGVPAPVEYIATGHPISDTKEGDCVDKEDAVVVSLPTGCTEQYTYDGSTYCPDCGSKGLYVSHDEDYYAGPTYICCACGRFHHISSRPVYGKIDQSGLDQLRVLLSQRSS
jgi:hypothetical protein